MLPRIVAHLRRPRTIALLVLTAVWATSVIAASTAVWRYKSTPGQAKNAGPHWPVGTALTRATDRPTLVMFAHPHCPCTKASIEEYAKLTDRLGDVVSANVVFIVPRGADKSWTETGTYRRAQSLPGVRVSVDTDGSEAARFGALTSGYTLLYDEDGQTLFAGGVTLARGHAGDNPGSRRILTLLNNKNAERRTSPVFGCALFSRTVMTTNPGRSGV